MEETDILKREAELYTLKEVNKVINSGLDFEEKLKVIIDKVSAFFNTEKCSLMLRDRTGSLFIVAAKGLEQEVIRNTKIKEGEGIAGLVTKNGRALLVKDIETSKVPRGKGDYKTKSLLSFPVTLGGKVQGVINVTDKKSGILFSEEDITIMSSFAEQIAILLNTASLADKAKFKLYY